MNLIDEEIAKRERLKRIEKKEQAFRRTKLLVIGSFFILALIVLTGRIFYIKTAYGEVYERKALENQYNQRNVETTINPNRGSIVDRNNQSLATSQTVYKVILDIRRLVEEDKKIQNTTVANLSKYLEMPETEIRELLRIDPATQKPVIDRHYYDLTKNKKISRKTKIELMESGVKCVYAEADTARSYVHDTLASQVIGFIRGDSPWGLEKQYNTEMSGVEGRMFRYYDSKNNPVSEQKEPQDGYTLVTTLDTNIQKFAEEAATTAGREYQSKFASVLVMNPMTGEVLAMAQYPTFNLNKPDASEYFTNTGYDVQPEEAPIEITDQQRLDELYRVWTNYNISRTFEPGSIFKPIVVAAAIEEGLIAKNSKYFCEGVRTIYDQDIPCWIHTSTGHGHGELTLTQVLAQSCNMGMIDIGNAIGRDFFYKYQHDFGFGEVTGIDLPGEASAEKMLHSLSGLGPVEIAAGSIGQGFNVTAIQAITAFSAIINGGNVMRPYVVSQVMDRQGNIVKENVPSIERKVISRETSNYMRQTMQEVVTPNGTGKKAVIEGYAIGGKTGTAQQGKKIKDVPSEYVLSFMAYLPVEEPNIIALAIIDRPKEYNEGSTSTAPMLKAVLQKIINYKAIKPSSGTAEDGTKSLIEERITIDDYTNMKLKNATQKLNVAGIGFECIGNGDIIVRQTPPPGAVGDKDSRLYFTLGESAQDVGLSVLPDTKNAGVETAQSILERAGFTVSVQIDGSGEQSSTTEEDSENNAEVTSGESVSAGYAIVYEQMPSGGIKIEPGTEIKIRAR